MHAHDMFPPGHMQCDMRSPGEKTEVNIQLLVIKTEVSMHEFPPLLKIPSK
jgi:hypothetical protein